SLERALDLAGVDLAFASRARAADLVSARRGLSPVFLDEGKPEDRKSGTRWEDLAAGEPRLSETDSAAEAAVFFTSGTTGSVKAVPLTHANIGHQIDTLVDSKLVTPDDTMLMPLPLHHVYPFVVAMLLPLALGMTIVLPASLTGPELVRALRDGDVSVVTGVPRLYSALLDGIEANASSGGALASLWFSSMFAASAAIRRSLGVRVGNLLLAPVHARFGPSLDVVASGGAPLRPETAWRLEAMGWRVSVGYGLTETSPILTLDPPGRARIGSVGRAIAGVELRLDRESAPEGSESAEVQARGPNVFAGYLGDEEETRSAFTDDGWFRTGDLGRFDDEGYLYLSGRESSLIVTEGGENVWPEEVEAAYEQEDAVREIGVFDREGRLFALVVAAPGAAGEGLDLEGSVRRAVEGVSRTLPSYKRISGYAVTRRPIERTRLGKIRRHLLPERYEEARESDGVEKGPMSADEMEPADRRLLEHPAAARVWEWFTEKYPRFPLTPDTSPRLDLGVDSLEWLSLTMTISQRAGVSLDEGTIAQVETVRDLLKEVAEAKEGRSEVSLEALFDEPESFLDERQRRSLRPHGPAEEKLALGLVGTVRGLARWLYDLEVEGAENIPESPPYLITPNHVSFLDPFVLGAAMGTVNLRHVYWSGWERAAFSNPLKRGISRLARTVPVDPHRAAISSLALGAAVLKRGHALVWFPEGTRSRSGRIEDFKPGVGLLLDAYRVPVLPVIIHGSHEAWPVGRKFPGLHPIRVVFGDPLSPEDLEERGDGEEAPERIASALRASMIELARGDV
ncbi:MAG: AMP-binding protein, partial [Candidatus Eisenbacteria bacterium]|nr:AMP-binding protein [Candidatus Eisenbacteria bacterium]